MDGWLPRGDRMTEAAAQRRIARWTGIAAQYDAYRLAAPAVIPSLLTQLAGVERPALVVDLGSGTGLSTLTWAGRAERVVGVEPNDDMREQAQTRLQASGQTGDDISFIAGTAERTGLPDGCVDIITVSQAFHWMEPGATLGEVARLLRPGGVFAAYDYDWPPTITPETEMLFHRFMTRVLEVAAAHGVESEPPGWEKSGHLRRMRESGYFRFTKEIVLHNVEYGDAERFIGLTFSNVVSRMLAQDGLTAAELELEAYERAVRDALPEGGIPWYIGYHVRVGVS